MTQEHLRNLIERAVEKVCADNTEQNFIRVGVRYPPADNTDDTILRAKLSIYEKPYYLKLAQITNRMTNTTGYQLGSSIDNTVRSIPVSSHDILNDEQVQNQVVDVIYDQIKSKELDLEDVPNTSTQDRLDACMSEVWENMKASPKNTGWKFKPVACVESNTAKYEWDLGYTKSLMSVTMRQPGEIDKYENGCVEFKSTNQPHTQVSMNESIDISDMMFEFMQNEYELIQENCRDLVREFKVDQSFEPKQ